MVKAIGITVFIISLIVSHTAWTQNSVNRTGQLISGGRTRTFSYHLPTNQPEDGLPLLIGYHGNYASGAAFQMYAGLDAVADSQNFIAVYPDGVIIDQVAHFNYYADDVPGFGSADDLDGPNPVAPDAPDDILFTADLIDYFIKTYHINHNRVYATGHSSGGVMCYYASVALAYKIAAFVPVASGLWGNKKYLNDYFTSSKYIKTPILHVHSAGDLAAPLPIPSYPKPATDVWPLSTFGRLNGNSTGTYSTNVLSDYVDSLTFCGTGKKVILLVTKDATHAWSSQFNTAQVLWDFVKNFQLNSTVENPPKGLNQMVIAPNPTKGVAQIHFKLAKQEEATLSVSSLSGFQIYQQRVIGTGEDQIESIDLSKVAIGSYFVKLQNAQGVQVRKVLNEY
ncbi:T9SS type A sorting domain-containing protein [Spirosoma aerolatum]|uniref:T9SS type A sorting domain-containing protein n=1 Tax=Spirosoma aerolatum TaxID=1211326 RepID=UPI0009AD3139|nr:T9SS type A sorting domain-containing protein [Spirosoma aerolatum]